MSESPRYRWLTSDHMARLLDAAFAEWAARPSDGKDKRRTPRIPLGDRPQVRIAFYRIHNEEIACHQSATLLDISAEGLRITTSETIPVHATVFFDLAAESGEQQLGCATVVRCHRHDDVCELGLRFGEDVASLDVIDQISALESKSPIRVRVDALTRTILSAAKHAFHVVSQRATSRVFLTASRGGTNAWFLVEAKLTRYCATLVVDGQKVATQERPLVDRIRNLVSDAARPTMVQLSSHGFSGWAMVRPHTVTTHDLIVEGKIVRKAKHEAALTEMLTEGTNCTGGVAQNTGVQTPKTRRSSDATHVGWEATAVAKSARR